MNIVFSIVLYKTNFTVIKKILNCIDIFRKIYSSEDSKKFDVSILVLDNYSQSDQKFKEFMDKQASISYLKSKVNLGYGRGHNLNFSRFNEVSDFIFIPINPDIKFDPEELSNLLDFYKKNKNDIACLAPLIYFYNGEIQYSAKLNPSIIRLLVSRFQILRRIKYFNEIYKKYVNKWQDYENSIIYSTYLSGCFLLIPSKVYKKVNGFSEEFFLHLEDADITRKCAKFGKTLHYPHAKIYHQGGRGSHKSLTQQIALIKSMFIYFSKWGWEI